MINGISNTTSEASFEQLYINGCLTAESNHISINVIHADLEVAQQFTYDSFLSLFQSNNYIKVNNTTCLLAFDRFTSSATVEGEIVLDYLTLDPEDKAAVDNFISLVDTLVNT